MIVTRMRTAINAALVRHCIVVLSPSLLLKNIYFNMCAYVVLSISYIVNISFSIPLNKNSYCIIR